MILLGDCRSVLPTLDAGSVRCCVTSPPYWGLRDYGTDGQIGLEKTPEEYVAEIVGVFRAVWRVLADDGTLWLNLGDSYCPSSNNKPQVVDSARRPRVRSLAGDPASGKQEYLQGTAVRPAFVEGLKPKDLVGIPWRVAFALQADGWYLRSDIIWAKPNPMPESVTDRPTKSHEYVFLLSKSARYYYDAAAIAEPAQNPDGFKYEGGYRETLSMVEESKRVNVGSARLPNGTVPHYRSAYGENRNARSVWTIPTQPTPDAHFATFPEALAERCILAGSAEGDTVLDPFFGSGTVGAVAERLGRRWIGIELNESYTRIAREKTAQKGLFL